MRQSSDFKDDSFENIGYIQDAICPKCGEPSKTGEICGACRVSEIEWFTYEPRVIITRCPQCNALYDHKMWIDDTREREELEYEAVINAVRFYRDSENPEIGISLFENSTNRTFATVELSCILYGVSCETTVKVEIIWRTEACTRCARQFGNYYEGVVQLRADGRKATPAEQEEARKIAIVTEQTLNEEGDRLSFIANMEDTREGLDITIGSKAIGEQISRDIVKKMGGRYSFHPTLIGEKEGKRIFRVTYSVRLMKFPKGSIIKIKQTYGEIIGGEGKTFTYLDLKTGFTKTVADTTAAELIGTTADAKPYMVVYTDAGIVGIMNEESGETKEVRAISYKDIMVGEQIRVITDKQTSILLP
ncbi:MAG: 60S ribosomal export protein NMD3 [Methanomicrobiales archaeon]|jgi:nonsense-mediated mRNA decay protein 3|nr:60S ribosomal export protein NMD3 [Methanomicrobiales archaeon]